jgi:hypothetical protein
MRAAGGCPAPGAARAELEQRYRRLLRLYPREFRARRQDELLGVLMASAVAGQGKPARGDVTDIIRSSLVMRLRGPRGGWRFALSAFALVSPLFLVLTDILQVAFPYSESRAAMQSRISRAEAHGVPAADLPPSLFVPQHAGGLPLLSQPAFLVLLAGHLIVAAAVLAGLRRTALAALVIAAAADATQWRSYNVWHQSAGTVAVLTIGVFVLEAIVLAAADPRVARRREAWRLMVPALVLAGVAQLWALAFDAARVPLSRGYLEAAIGGPVVVTGFALVALAVLLPLPLGFGWRTSLFLAAACYPLVILAATLSGLFSRTIGIGRLGQALGTVPSPVAHTEILTILFLPSLLVLCWAVAQTIRMRRPRNSDLAA